MKLDGEFCVATTMKIVGSKWTAVILYQLMSGTKRFGQIQNSIKGISPKILSTRLQELAKQGIISRKVYAEVPLHVEYTLTKRGESLNAIIMQMYQWGKKSLRDSSNFS